MFLCESRTPIDSKKKGCDVNVKSLYQICFIHTDKWKEKRGHSVEGLELSALTQLSPSLITVTTINNSRTIIITTTTTNTTSSTLWCPDVYSFKMFDLHDELWEYNLLNFNSADSETSRWDKIHTFRRHVFFFFFFAQQQSFYNQILSYLDKKLEMG